MRGSSPPARGPRHARRVGPRCAPPVPNSARVSSTFAWVTNDTPPTAPPRSWLCSPNLAAERRESHTGADAGRHPRRSPFLDLSDDIAGPVAALLLAEAGADVVKVEPPGGSPTRCPGSARGTAANAACNSTSTSRATALLSTTCSRQPTCSCTATAPRGGAGHRRRHAGRRPSRPDRVVGAVVAGEPSSRRPARGRAARRGPLRPLRRAAGLPRRVYLRARPSGAGAPPTSRPPASSPASWCAKGRAGAAPPTPAWRRG